MNTVPISRIAGVDEAGRGPLAGPVVAATVILHPQRSIGGLRDSKKLTAARRDALYAEIIDRAWCYGIGYASAEEIDRLNILRATLLAMRRAVDRLSLKPDKLLVDGLQCPATDYPAEAIVRGDDKHAEISAASVIAKVTRDRHMLTLDQQYPGYDFAGHKGYPTKRHLQALTTLGPCPEHRRSFAPVRRAADAP